MTTTPELPVNLPLIDRWWQTGEVPDEVIQTVELVKLFEVSEGRNAWYSIWTEYLPAICGSFRAARQAAEADRKQGSKLSIGETFGAAFKGTTSSIVVLRWPDSVRRFIPKHASKLLSLARYAQDAGTHRTYLAGQTEFEHADRIWRGYRPQPGSGKGGSLLEWRQEASEHPNPAFEVAEQELAKYLASGTDEV